MFLWCVDDYGAGTMVVEYYIGVMWMIIINIIVVIIIIL